MCNSLKSVCAYWTKLEWPKCALCVHALVAFKICSDTFVQALCIIPLIDTLCTSLSFINQENFSLDLYKVPVYWGNGRIRERGNIKKRF